MIRTDLAYEIASKKEITTGLTLERAMICGISATKITVSPEGSKVAGKPPGNYITLFCPEKNADMEINALAETLCEMLPPSENTKTLVAGLGNENITPDSLGARAAGRVLATAHFSGQREFGELDMREVYVVEPGVMAQTGIESAEQLKYIADGINPDCVIVIDSLACSEKERLGRTIQVTDTGISPGSGVKNERKELSRNIFGVPVIAVGVPTVIDLQSLVKTHGGDIENADYSNSMVVPRDIDVTVNHFAKVISKAINKALNPSLDEEEIDKLLF